MKLEKVGFYVVQSIMIQLSLSILSFSLLFLPYSSAYEGTWVDADIDYCKKTYLCTKSFKTWQSDQTSTLIIPWNNTTGCDIILSRGINRLMFFGDSYMRHIYIAMLLTLSNNYRNAGLSRPNENCEYSKQFDEKECRSMLKLSSTVCNSKLRLMYSFDIPGSNICNPSQLSFLSVGNHPVDYNYNTRHGVNNATIYATKFKHTELCRTLVTKHNFNISMQCPFFWVSTHARFKGSNDERMEQIKAYNEDMRAFFSDPSHCGSVKYIDVYNMTASLLSNMYEDAKLLTHDGAHWSIEVNLIKAQILLNNIQSQL